jgi:hypothetical protein
VGFVTVAESGSFSHTAQLTFFRQVVSGCWLCKYIQFLPNQKPKVFNVKLIRLSVNLENSRFIVQYLQVGKLENGG